MTEKTLGQNSFEDWFSAQIWGNEDFKTCLRMAWEDCAQAVAKAVREQCAQACRDQEEPKYYGFENPYSFYDGRDACVDAIEAMNNEVKP